MTGDVVGTLDDAAIAMHEMYESLRRAGFNADEALKLVVVMASRTKEDES